jgi:hypothetical protein
MLSLRANRNASGNKKKKSSHAKNKTLVLEFPGFVQSNVFNPRRVVPDFHNSFKTAKKGTP